MSQSLPLGKKKKSGHKPCLCEGVAGLRPATLSHRHGLSCLCSAGGGAFFSFGKLIFPLSSFFVFLSLCSDLFFLIFPSIFNLFSFPLFFFPFFILRFCPFFLFGKLIFPLSSIFGCLFSNFVFFHIFFQYLTFFQPLHLTVKLPKLVYVAPILLVFILHCVPQLSCLHFFRSSSFSTPGSQVSGPLIMASVSLSSVCPQ